MNVELFLKHREVKLSLLSLVGQILIISFVSASLVYGDVSSERATLLIIVLISFIFVFLVTIRRLVLLAKSTDSLGS
ncbi:hypothetical protein V7O62_05655 [Methanolobus sp. ZRKC2]|uniref:hypothetical protein n=1 Tax=Methanolobus sp. ZRKC2 TaxID=3125783 RepID=UPI00324679BB